MQLHRFTNPQAFYDRIEPFLMTHEAENNLPLGLVGALIQDIQRYGDDPPYMALVEDDGQVVHMAMRTPPFKVVNGLTTNLEAVKLVAQDAYEVYGEDMPGVNGPSEVAKAFAEHWQTITGQSYELNMSMRMFRLDEVNPPTGVPGQLRRINEGDRPLMVEWVQGFHQDALGDDVGSEHAQKTFDRHLASTDGTGLHVWEHDGEVVSIASGGRPTPNGISIGLVYTPPEKRRKGYASACVAALSQHFLDNGYTFCFLYTNLANPTSNHIYQEIGYRPVCDADDYLFS